MQVFRFLDDDYDHNNAKIRELLAKRSICRIFNIVAIYFTYKKYTGHLIVFLIDFIDFLLSFCVLLHPTSIFPSLLMS